MSERKRNTKSAKQNTKGANILLGLRPRLSICFALFVFCFALFVLNQVSSSTQTTSAPNSPGAFSLSWRIWRRARLLHDRPAPCDEQTSRRFERFFGDAEDDELPVDAETSQYRVHRFAARHSCEDDPCAAELGKFHRGVLRLAIDVTPRAELHGQRLFVPPSRNDDGLETHLRSELNGHMTEAPHSQYGDRLPGPRAAVSKRVEGGDSRAHQRPRVYVRKPFRDQRQRSGGSDHVFGVAAVVRDAGNLKGDLAGNEVAATARIAAAAVSAMPADSDPLA